MRMLELQSLSGGYGGVTVLRNVSITVPASSVVALIGPNGAGKTTTLKMASGLLRPREGRLILRGRDVTKATASQRVRMGLCHLIEGRGVFPSLTVRENVALFAPKGKEFEAFDEAAAAFPILGERRRQQAGTLSGGEQQMLALARAYVSRPQVVLVDEASLGLAPLVVETIFAFLDRLTKQGISLLLVEQYVSRALALADSVYVLHKGEVVYQGSSADLNEERLFALYAGEAA
jgi:branched-chain amino acid transport system ATP-binding protein